MYKEWMTTNNPDDVPLASARQYKEIFQNQFNIGFFKPKKDRCDTCEKYKNADDLNKEEMQVSYDLHIFNKVTSRSLKDMDKKYVSEHKSSANMACFDFQKIFQAPSGEVSSFYYRRKLSSYNFTVYDVVNFHAINYVYDESIGSKGANEVASFVFDYISKKKQTGYSDFYFYSDNCSGQNRNKFVFSMYVLAAVIYKVKITHRFLEPGHTQNEGDSVHSTIERNCRHKTFYTPAQWYECIKTARKSKRPFEVLEVDQSLIRNWKHLEAKLQWPSKNDEGEKFLSRIKEILCHPDYPGILKYKMDFDEEYSCIDLVKNSGENFLQSYQLNDAYSGPLHISTQKIADLLYLCNNFTIPIPHHQFYKKLAEKNPQEKNALPRE